MVADVGGARKLRSGSAMASPPDGNAFSNARSGFR
jgi:hypothetical protein